MGAALTMDERSQPCSHCKGTGRVPVGSLLFKAGDKVLWKSDSLWYYGYRGACAIPATVMSLTEKRVRIEFQDLRHKMWTRALVDPRNIEMQPDSISTEDCPVCDGDESCGQPCKPKRSAGNSNG